MRRRGKRILSTDLIASLRDNVTRNTTIQSRNGASAHRPVAQSGRCRVRELSWVDWFNTRRLLEPIGNLPPVAIENAFYDHNGPQTEAS
jgi:hypothetical protein